MNCGRRCAVAGKEIRKLNFGRADTPVLKLLRRVLREARAVAAARKERGGGVLPRTLKSEV
jgi:hypothetical protein